MRFDCNTDISVMFTPALGFVPSVCLHWAIPENIHTIPRTAFRISEGEGGFTIMEF